MIKYVFVSLFILLSVGTSMSYMASSSIRSFIAMQNAFQTQNALNRLKQSVVYHNGSYFAPTAFQGEEYSELPLEMTGSRTNSKGLPFLYCPYGSPLFNTPNSVISDAAGASYNIVTSTISGVSVVQESAPPPVDGLLAAIILPRAGSPSCADISVSADGHWVLTGDSAESGQVYAIHRDEMVFEGGKGLWVTAENNAQLRAALTDAEITTLKDVVITLKPGVSFELDRNYVFSSPGLTVRIKSASDTLASISSASGAARTLSFNGVSVEFEYVQFSTDISVNIAHANITSRSATLGGTQLISGHLRVENSLFVSGDSSALVLKDSTADMTNSVSFKSAQSPVVDIHQSRVIASASAISFLQDTPVSLPVRLTASSWLQNQSTLSLGDVASGGSGLFIDASSSFSSQSSDVISSGSPDAAIYVEGNLFLPNSRVLGGGNASIYAGATGSVVFTNSQIGTAAIRPLLGIWSEGARFGGSVNVYAATCKSGSGFNVAINVSVDDDTVTFANPDGTVVASTNTDIITVPVFDKINTVQINCL